MKTSLQPVCPSEEGTAGSHRRRDLDRKAGGGNLVSLFFKVLNYCSCFVGAGIVEVDEVS